MLNKTDKNYKWYTKDAIQKHQEVRKLKSCYYKIDNKPTTYTAEKNSRFKNYQA
jgi:hypothetical protein